MRRVATGIVGKADAEDVVAESICRAWKGWATYDGRAKVTTWLTACARNTAVMHVRAVVARPQRTVNHQDEEFVLEWLRDESPSVDAVIYEKQARQAVHAAIARLSPDRRRSFDGWLAGEHSETSTQKVQAYRAMPGVIADVRRRLGIDDNRGENC